MRFLLIAAVLAWTLPAQAQDVTIGSKKFTESVILGEIARQLVKSSEKSARHRRELGGTRVLWEALLKGNIDIYPEYTGTISQELLADRNIDGMDAMRIALNRQGIRMTAPMGFNNTYAIGVTAKTAEKYGLRKISDLRPHTGLALGFSNEFMDRADGWPALRQKYGLNLANARGLDHDLAYRGLAGAVSTPSTSTPPMRRSPITSCMCWKTIWIISPPTKRFSCIAPIWPNVCPVLRRP